MQTNEPEIYPMPSFLRLAVEDVELSRGWYRALGFQDIFTLTGQSGMPIMSHLRWAKYADLMLVERRAPERTAPPGMDVTIYFSVERGTLDKLAELAGSSILEGPVLQPWNARELIVRDPDGFRIAFAEQGETNRSLDEVMNRVREMT